MIKKEKGDLKLPIVIHDDLLSKIYNYYKDKAINDTALASGVYTFLYKTARHQNNIRVFATDTFIKKGTGVGTDKLKKIKKDLKALDLIEIIRPRGANGKYTKEVYIEVKFVWKDSTLDKLFYNENTEVTRYKIARELLLENFDEYEDIEARNTYEFYVSINGHEEEISADSFYFEDDLLKCTAEFKSGNTMENYTVPSSEVEDIILHLANCYNFNFNAINKVLQKESS